MGSCFASARLAFRHILLLPRLHLVAIIILYAYIYYTASKYIENTFRHLECQLDIGLVQTQGNAGEHRPISDQDSHGQDGMEVEGVDTQIDCSC